MSNSRKDYHAARPRLQWFQFSIRSMILLASLCCVMAWAVSVWNRAEKQRALVELLQGERDLFNKPIHRVVYDFERNGLESPRYVPRPIVSVLGRDVFA